MIWQLKKNSIINNSEKINNNNIWNLKTQSEELNKKIEYNGVYNGFINKVYLLDYKQKPKITSINKKIFMIINIKVTIQIELN